jgi:hypothetical protein
MGCRGVHFAILPTIGDRLKQAKSNEDVLKIAQEEIEGAWDKDWLCQTDKAWDAIHRCLTDGGLSIQPEPYPLALCILGGRQLYEPESEYRRGYFISLVEAEEVPKVSAAIGAIGRDDMRRRYFALDPDQYDGPMGDQDWEYTWEYFADLQRFFAKAAHAGRAVLFCVDQ